jgi:hypothetical protein
MRKLILFLLVFVSAKVSAQVYQEMPQYGYRANRMAFDSTLQIPTVCGVPTLKSVVKTNKSGAIAYDSCNAIFYTYNPKTLTWTALSSGGGGSTDTTSLSNRINLKIDSLKRSNDSVYAYRNGTRVFQFKDSVGGGGSTPTLQQVTTAGSTTTNTIVVGNVSSNYIGIDPNQFLVGNGTESISITSNRITSTNSSGAIDAFQFPTSATSNATIPISVNGNTANSNGNITISTGGVAVDTIFRTLGKDSIFYKKNNITYAIKDSVGGGSSDTIFTQSPIMYITRNDSNIIFFNSDTANVWRSNDTSKVVIAQVYNATATTLLKGEVVYLFGSTGNVASVKRANNKQDSTSSKTLGLVRRDIPAGGTGFVTTQGQIEKLNLGSYVEGDVLWLDSLDGQFTKVKPQAPYHGVFIGVVERANNGNGLAYIKPQNGVELDEVHDVQINSILNNQIIVYSDTQKVWKNRNINSLIDTTLFQRKSLSANTIMANNTSATANATAQQFRDTSGVYPSGSINWTGTTAPSGTTTHTYRLTQVGKCVTVHIALVYATNGSALTSIQLLLPPNAPAPAQPTGLTGSIFNMYPVYGQLVSSTNQSILSVATRGFLRNNSTPNGYEIFLIFSSTAPGQLGVTCQYWTN